MPVSTLESARDAAKAEGTGEAQSAEAAKATSGGTDTSAASTEAKTETAVQSGEKKTIQDLSAGQWHNIRWGDTLWDISTRYYRNPWKYHDIARHPRNRIKNPDRILAGFKVFIPKN